MYEMSRYEIAPHRQRVVWRSRCVPLARSTRSRIFPFFWLTVRRYAGAVTTSRSGPRSVKATPAACAVVAPAPAAERAAAAGTSAAVARRRLLESSRPPERTVPDDAHMRVVSLTACVLAASALTAVPGTAGKSRELAGPFVTQSGPHLLLSGRPYRFGGANIEWLGLAGYGPSDPAGPHYASHYEIDDALATARELGANVVRSQTMADSAGCAACIEPELGQFSDAAFERIDYALASARARGIKIIATLVGDDAASGGTGCVYLGWRGISVPNCSLVNMDPFWSDPAVIGDVEQHIAAVLGH